MRKNTVPIVLLLGCLMSPSHPATVTKEETVKIFGSLEEAVQRPARPLLLVFFSLECHLCWAELFEMRYFLEKNSIPVDLVGISRESEEELRPFLSKYAFSYPVVSDRGKTLYRRFKVRLEPFRVILNHGSVLYEDDSSQDFFVRRDKVKRCLIELASR
jgi:peroxiredoxin